MPQEIVNTKWNADKIYYLLKTLVLQESQRKTNLRCIMFETLKLLATNYECLKVKLKQ